MTKEEREFLQIQIISITGEELSSHTSDTLFREKLAAYIRNLINNDFQKLISILYRLDVSEKKLKDLLAQTNSDAGFIIADAIIERQSEKIISRKNFNSHGKNIPDEEKW
jgi:hypothetical protein